MAEFVFWQRMVSPLMAGLARALAARGAKVTYVASEAISKERARQGWSAPELPGVCLELVADAARTPALSAGFPQDAIHLTQGVRRNSYVKRVISMLRKERARWGTTMETIDDRGLRGVLKRVDYAWALGPKGMRPDFVLAIGERMPEWVAARGFPRERVFPFTYFLDLGIDPLSVARRDGPFRIGFVGQLIRRKRFDLLIQALAGVNGREFHLVVIGNGPLEGELRQMAETRLGKERIRWLGRLPMMVAHAQIAELDCLVLPSDHDGWGAVVSEALMAGVPAICSDACGSAAAVHASGMGGVFPSRDLGALRFLLAQSMGAGPVDAACRTRLAEWACCLSSNAGAHYLDALMASVYMGQTRPPAPWDSSPQC